MRPPRTHGDPFSLNLARSASENPPSGPTNSTIRRADATLSRALSLRSSRKSSRSVPVTIGDSRNLSSGVGGRTAGSELRRHCFAALIICPGHECAFSCSSPLCGTEQSVRRGAMVSSVAFCTTNSMRCRARTAQASVISTVGSGDCASLSYGTAVPPDGPSSLRLALKYPL